MNAKQEYIKTRAEEDNPGQVVESVVFTRSGGAYVKFKYSGRIVTYAPDSIEIKTARGMEE